MDFASLYTNVQHTEVVEVLKYFLDKRGTLSPPTFLVKMSELILNRNYFKFEDAYFLQCKVLAWAVLVVQIMLIYLWVSLRKILCITIHFHLF